MTDRDDLVALEQELRAARQRVTKLEAALARAGADDPYPSAEQRLQLLTRTIPHLVVMTSLSDGTLLYCNEATARFAGSTVEELIGRKVPDFYVDENDRARLVQAVREHGRLQGYEVWLRSADGEPRLVSASAEFVEVDGEPALMGVSIDITETRQHERALAEANARQEALLREINHRVGNHLSALVSMLRRERRSASDDTVAATVLDKLSVRLQGLVRTHRLLSATRWQPVRLTALVTSVVEATTSALSPGARVVVDGDGTLVTSAQAHQLALVLSELTMNAAKHAGELPLRLAVRVERSGRRVQLVFADHGPGYPAALLHHGACAASGLELVEQIVRHSLRGRIALHNAGGAVATVSFQHESPAPPVD